MSIQGLKKRLDTQYRGRIVLSLLLLGGILLALRFLLTTGGGVPANDKVYALTYDINFKAEDARAIITLSPPWDTAHALVIAQTIENPGLRLLRSRADKELARNITAMTTSPGNKRLLAEFTIHVSPLGHKRLTPKSLPLTTTQRERYLQRTDDIDIDSPEVMDIIAKLAEEHEQKEHLLEYIFKYANKDIVLDENAPDDDASTVLRTHMASTLGRTRAMVALCRAAKIPARVITGFVLKEGFDVQEHYWVETYDDNKWLAHDPENGYFEQLPPDFLPVRRGGVSIIGDTTVSDIRANYDITEQFVPIGKLGGEASSIFDILDISRLSLDARKALAILLLLPLGALFTTFCTSIIGIRTYGTFTPTLIALAARYADWITAIVIFSIVAVMGLLGRSFLPDKLTRVPRLTIVFTVVAMSMTLGVSLMDYFSFNPAGDVVLLPIIILTSLIDRLYKALDEDGARIAMTRFGWTLAVAFGCYFILIQEQLGHFILEYPEVHLFTIAAVLLFSAYRYKKLSEAPFLKWLSEPKKEKPAPETREST